MAGHKNRKPEAFSQLPWGALRRVARHYGEGAEARTDGDPLNYRRGYDWSAAYDALQRHASQFWEPVEGDEEGDAYHLSAVVFHALTLLGFLDEHPDKDDRPRAQLAGDSEKADLKVKFSAHAEPAEGKACTCD